MQALASRRDYCATATMTVRMVLMRTVIRCGKPVLQQSSTQMSKAGQQDMGKTASMGSTNGVKGRVEGHYLH